MNPMDTMRRLLQGLSQTRRGHPSSEDSEGLQDTNQPNSNTDVRKKLSQ